MRPVNLFRIVADEFSLFAIHHIGLAPSVIDGSVTAQNVLAQSKMLLAEVDCQVTTMSLGKSRVTAIVSGL